MRAYLKKQHTPHLPKVVQFFRGTFTFLTLIFLKPSKMGGVSIIIAHLFVAEEIGSGELSVFPRDMWLVNNWARIEIFLPSIQGSFPLYDTLSQQRHC